MMHPTLLSLGIHDLARVMRVMKVDSEVTSMVMPPCRNLGRGQVCKLQCAVVKRGVFMQVFFLHQRHLPRNLSACPHGDRK